MTMLASALLYRPSYIQSAKTTIPFKGRGSLRKAFAVGSTNVNTRLWFSMFFHRFGQRRFLVILDFIGLLWLR